MEKLPSSKIIGLVTTVDTEIVQTPTGPMLWGAVELLYSSDSMEPRINIRVPIPAIEEESDEQRRSETLRRARKLIDHACVAMNPEPDEPGITEVLKGLGQELGVLPVPIPETGPAPTSRQNRGGSVPSIARKRKSSV